jgi:hypothetical protein
MSKYFQVVRDRIENRVGEKLSLEHAKQVLADLSACVQKLEAVRQSAQLDRDLPLVEEVICPICQSIVRLYDGNKIGMHTPHSNVNEPICKMVGAEIMPRK